ncbi:MAG: VWA domain-containing protein [Nocardioides sp.]|uniref:VWA domain-containing protein n=1 Tax=Nocardioides sp. TaxID=35761 RepID=UPI0039E2684D
MSLLDRHLAFLEALRGAGVPVSLAEGLDAVAGTGAIGWSSRERVKDAYAATLIKRQANRPTFDALFELYFPRMVGNGEYGARAGLPPIPPPGAIQEPPGPPPEPPDAAAAAEFRDRVSEALGVGGADSAESQEVLRRLAAEAMARFGAMPGRGPGLSSWSAYTAMRRISADELVARLLDALRAGGWTEAEAARSAHRRVGGFTALVEADARRRIAEEKGPQRLAAQQRPALDRLDLVSLRRTDLDDVRREIYPLARRLAARLAREQHHRRRGPLDMRATLRASMASGGVPLETRHRPKRPHRSDLVVLCDVSGSVANFASFTLLLVFALQEVFARVRAFTFVDAVHEVTPYFGAGGDLGETMTRLVRASEHAALLGRTNYGRAFGQFTDRYADALTPTSTLLILGDARGNYADPNLPALSAMAGAARRAFWLNPEARHAWDTGDSEAGRYAGVVEMVECRNLAQLSEFVHQVA